MTLARLPARRKIVLGAVLAASTVAACESDTEPVHLATAHQMGPVAYRDPAGAASPDGRWLAFTEGSCSTHSA